MTTFVVGSHGITTEDLAIPQRTGMRVRIPASSMSSILTVVALTEIFIQGESDYTGQSEIKQEMIRVTIL